MTEATLINKGIQLGPGLPWWKIGRHGAGAVAESLHFHLQAASRKRERERKTLGMV